ncbi:PEP/pyruvate-binding domain-containing protein [Thiosulfativibrio zosterae]|uniref:Phosphoenolpyruvate synthase n=1 Tax=Thiosulfativibrio zosterae TaxID=2675053 RepID=A0A6F8PM11_9GAMM|nr:PEP/pyruvate-binding domain-containing protein [Thiosulfativibrio zosterae]BBP43108.1 hypothetical protein THMIRHAT_08540 [Thiosulfativibrio zosterae]
MKSKIAILAAGMPHFGELPSLSSKVGGLSILDWQLNSLKALSAITDVVVGFRASELDLAQYASINLIENPHWQSTGSVGSLLLVDIEDCDELWVSYGDVVYHQKPIERMSEIDSDVVIAYDSEWTTRYLGRDLSDIKNAEKVILTGQNISRLGQDINLDWATGEFIGLVRITGEALAILKKLKIKPLKNLANLSLPDLLELLRLKGAQLIGFDIKGQWAELNESRDLAHFVMGTKSETLLRLHGMLKSAVIQEQASFSVADWKTQSQDLIRQIQANLPHEKLVVRSSALSEDAFTHSNAGAYTSVLNVQNNIKDLTDAIIKVINSYDNLQLDDQVLVQPMLTDVVMSGVVFTRTLEQGAPYYVINYEESGSTEGITSGHAAQNSVFYFYKKANPDKVSCKKLRNLIISLQEIELLLNYDALDIEFAVDKAGRIHIFQVRPISLHQNISYQTDQEIALSIEQAKRFYQQCCLMNDGLVGNRTILGNMPDWNPAEIIGTNPGNLSYSLYKYLILDEVWAQQRAEFGYRDVRPYGLLKRFLGQPYVDVRASFNSFIPKNLSNELAEKLVNFYSVWLVLNPHLHDKIEFEVVPTCLSLNFDRWKQRLIREGGFDASEVTQLKEGLKEVTNNAITRVESDLKIVEKLKVLLDTPTYNSDNFVSISSIKTLLDDCKRLGTLPFAHLARAGFIAITFLKDAVKVGVISKQAQEGFLESLKTVSHSFSEDAYCVKTSSMAWLEFVQKYGHLRPGTYDINSSAYHEDSEHYLKPAVERSQKLVSDLEKRNCWEKEKNRLFDGLRKIGILSDDEQLESFMRQAIEGREKAKFIFSRSLSKALDQLIIWGDRNQLSREFIAELSITQIFEHIEQISLSETECKKLKELANNSLQMRKTNLACELPPLIVSEQDFHYFTLNENHPNYIGSTKVSSVVIDLSKTAQNDQVSGKIVLIPQADPGYDWLFGQGIVGLITMYGGANSHMAIRSAEFGLPAAIGVGEALYKKLSQANQLELDPSNSLIRLVH